MRPLVVSLPQLHPLLNIATLPVLDSHLDGRAWWLQIWNKARSTLTHRGTHTYRKHSEVVFSCLSVNQKYLEDRIICCVTLSSADIRLIDDFVPHQSIMHNLTWIKSHINIITHWIFCIVWHASEELNPSLRRSDRGDAPRMSWQTHPHFPLHTHTHTQANWNGADVKMSDPYLL